MKIAYYIIKQFDYIFLMKANVSQMNKKEYKNQMFEINK